MNRALKSNDIPWSNCVGVSVDNTSVNLGKKNSIMTRAVQQNPCTYFMGCPCHIVHNVSMKAFTKVNNKLTSSDSYLISYMLHFLDDKV